MTPFISLICNKEKVHEIFYEIETTNNAVYTLAKNYFLTSSALQTLVPPDLCLTLRLSRILNISNRFPVA